jgi:hypothetical protein
MAQITIIFERRVIHLANPRQIPVYLTSTQSTRAMFETVLFYVLLSNSLSLANLTLAGLSLNRHSGQPLFQVPTSRIPTTLFMKACRFTSFLSPVLFGYPTRFHGSDCGFFQFFSQAVTLESNPYLEIADTEITALQPISENVVVRRCTFTEPTKGPLIAVNKGKVVGFVIASSQGRHGTYIAHNFLQLRDVGLPLL